MTANTDRVIAVAYTPNLTEAARGRFTPAGWSACGYAPGGPLMPAAAAA